MDYDDQFRKEASEQDEQIEKKLETILSIMYKLRNRVSDEESDENGGYIDSWYRADHLGPLFRPLDDYLPPFTKKPLHMIGITILNQ